jgi:hypothetical protein
MSTAAVFVAPEAERQIRAIDAWWREHRPSSPDLFAQELAQGVATLETLPFAGQRVEHATVQGLRRTLLRATRVHLYYVAESKHLVRVLAAWGAVRGMGPDLTHLPH